MKAAAVALVCVLRSAAPVQAADVARPASAAPPASASLAAPLAAAPVVAVAPPSTPARTDASVVPKPGGAAIKDPPRDPSKPRAEAGRRQRVCFGAAETRETVAARRLVEPFRALRVGGQQGEALRAKLCRWKKDELVYEISVLRRDGRIVHLYMNAQSGQTVGALDDRH